MGASVATGASVAMGASVATGAQAASTIPKTIKNDRTNEIRFIFFLLLDLLGL
jgi:hypothetical protein